MATKRPVLFSGIQPSGNLTIANYLGALKNWVQLQQEYDCLFSLVDLHTLTVRQDPQLLHEHCLDALALYLAVGIDPERHSIFLQSHVPAHTQLAWILSCYSYMGELQRMTQFKDKSKKNAENINVGLFSYPILMAADILLYATDLVPVGMDQKQHLEIARDLALRFNHIYGDIFRVPEGYFPQLGARVMSLQEPTKKMSKSDSNLNATIFLFDTPEMILDKCKRAVTDSGKEVYFDVKNKPGVANLLTIFAAITGKSFETCCAELQGGGYGKLKSVVAESLIEYLRPLQERYHNLRQDQVYLASVLQRGAHQAIHRSEQMLRKVYEALGLVRFKPQ